MIQRSTLKFLSALKRHNQKAWMDLHRHEYELAKQDFELFIQSVLEVFSKKDRSLEGLTAKSCIFRINRDIRFTKDKSPYKTNMGASLSKGGKKGIYAGYYFHLEPGHSFAGGGLYMPDPAVLAKVRQEIDYNFTDFKKILQARSFRSIYEELDSSPEFRLSRLPKGYELDHPASAFLRLKSLIAFRALDDKELTHSSLLKLTVKAFEALQPLITFLNTALDD